MALKTLDEPLLNSLQIALDNFPCWSWEAIGCSVVRISGGDLHLSKRERKMHSPQPRFLPRSPAQENRDLMGQHTPFLKSEPGFHHLANPAHERKFFLVLLNM
jgi:hypothetical protein